ncbi:MAG: hypothetical protein Q9195_005255 [Heterodermia aff. obscurata]
MLSMATISEGDGPSLMRAFAAISSFALFLYVVYGAIWRLYFSPIAKFPGPRFATLTFLNQLYYDIILGGKYTRKILDYHAAYGPIVRINPYELHINDPFFHEKLYVRSSKGKTDKWGWSMGALAALGSSLFTTLPHDLHRMRRAAWAPYFSKQSIRRIQPTLIQSCVDQTCQRLSEYQGRGKPVVMIYAWSALIADIISEYSFPHGYRLLDKAEFDEEHFGIWTALTRTLHPLRHFPWLFGIMDAMPLWLTKIVAPPFYLILGERDRLEIEAKAMITQRGSALEKDIRSRPSLLQALADTDLLPEREKTPARITSEAQTAMVAGTLTATRCLTVATYHILANKDILEKLMSELEDGIPGPQISASLDQLEKMPYLVAIMYESLRLFYGLSHRLARIFPDRPMYYKDWVIPAGVPVSMSIPHIHDNEDIFPEAYLFRPERWLPLETEGQRLLRFMVAFGSGSRQCIGMELAKAEILTALACVFRRFGHKMKLLDTVRERDVDPVDDYFDPQPSRQSNGVVVVIERDDELKA